MISYPATQCADSKELAPIGSRGVGALNIAPPRICPKVLELYPAPRSDLKGWIARVNVAENSN